jgi:hypothetical protein
MVLKETIRFGQLGTCQLTNALMGHIENARIIVGVVDVEKCAWICDSVLDKWLLRDNSLGWTAAQKLING